MATPINITALLLILLPLSLGLLKSQDGPLVASPEPDVVYLIQAPRSAFTISQAPLNIKVEAWLRINNVNHTSISSMVFLGSSTDGSVPFAEMNGQKVMAPDPVQGGNMSEGSDAIVAQVAAKFNLTWPEGKNGTEEYALRRVIDYDLFNTVVMYTRATVYRVSSNGSMERMGAGFNVSTMRLATNAQGQLQLQDGNGSAMRTGLDFMLVDESIRQQMFPLLVDLAADAQRTLLGIVLSRAAVNAYFDARVNGSEQAQQAFLADGGWDAKNISWAQLDAAMQQTCTAFLVSRLVLAPGGALDNARQFLQLNRLDGQPVGAYNEQQLVAKVQAIYGRIATQLNASCPKGGKRRLFLFGGQRTPADCSLFGSLTVFFEIPLSVPEMVTYMEAVRDDPAHPQHILHEFFVQMQSELDMSYPVWEQLSARPFPMNWEQPEQREFEVQMEEVVWAAAKRAFAVGATSRLDIGNEH